jgi:hypothetical protein
MSTEEEIVAISPDEEEDEDEEVDFFPALENFLVTSDGDNIADALVKSLGKISAGLETQNKILIKLYSELKK